jgi:hypothetical protein
MTTKYGGRPDGAICPADVRLKSNSHPLANNFGDKDGKRCTNHSADDPNAILAKFKSVEVRVIARPLLKWFRRACLAQLAHQISVWIKYANRRDPDIVQSLLSPRFAQQRLRRKDRF